MPYQLLTQMGLKQHKAEHQVRYDDGMTPDQTITDGTEPNSKLTAKMSVPGRELPRPVAAGAETMLPIAVTVDGRGFRDAPIALFCAAGRTANFRGDQEDIARTKNVASKLRIQRFAYSSKAAI